MCVMFRPGHPLMIFPFPKLPVDSQCLGHLERYILERVEYLSTLLSHCSATVVSYKGNKQTPPNV